MSEMQLVGNISSMTLNVSFSFDDTAIDGLMESCWLTPVSSFASTYISIRVQNLVDCSKHVLLYILFDRKICLFFILFLIFLFYYYYFIIYFFFFIKQKKSDKFVYSNKIMVLPSNLVEMLKGNMD